MASLFEDTFEVVTIDFDKELGVKEKKFDHVSRIDAKSEIYENELTIDINTSVYPMREGDKFELLLSDRLNPNDAEVEEIPGYKAMKELGSRADEFEYIMHGKVFKYAQEKSKAVVFASFGGLLMALKGEARILTSRTFIVDSSMYLFIRQVSKDRDLR